MTKTLRRATVTLPTVDSVAFSSMRNDSHRMSAEQLASGVRKDRNQ